MEVMDDQIRVSLSVEECFGIGASMFAALMAETKGCGTKVAKVFEEKHLQVYGMMKEFYILAGRPDELHEALGALATSVAQNG